MKPEVSEKEKIAISELRTAVADLVSPEWDGDFNFLRWLKGHDFNHQQILPKLRAHLKLRQLWGLDTVTQRSDEVRDPIVFKYWPFGLLGSSGDNKLLFVEAIGRTDFNGVIRSVSHTDFLRTRMHDVEVIVNKMRKYEQKTGKQHSLLFVMDLEGLSAWSFSTLASMVTGPLRCFAHFLTENYVEVFGKFLVVNAPSFIYYLWHLMRPLLPRRTCSKVEILSDNWKEELKQFADPDSIPMHWGGNLVDQYGDPKCAEFVKIPEKVPEALYWSPSENDPILETIWVPAGKARFVDVEVDRVGSKLSWYFVSHGDFSFGVYFAQILNSASDPDVELVYPFFPHLTQTFVPEQDHMICSKPGIYRLRFGNEHAWMKTLKIDYSVSLVHLA